MQNERFQPEADPPLAEKVKISSQKLKVFLLYFLILTCNFDF